MSLQSEVQKLFNVATDGVSNVDGRQYLPAPAAPAIGGTWSLFTTFGGGQRSQIWGSVKHAGAMYFGVGGDDDGVAQIWRNINGSWSNVTPGWGNIMRVPTMVSSGGYIYAGNASKTDEVQIWRSADGITWTKFINFGTSVSHLLSLTEYNGHLYVGCIRKNGTAQLYSTSNAFDAPVWTSPGSYLYSLEVHNGNLYIGTGYPAEVFKFDGTTFSQISNFNNPNLLIVETMVSYRGDLVVGFGREIGSNTNPPCVMSYNDIDGWLQVGETQPRAWLASHNFNTAVVVNDTLMMSMGSLYGDVSLWALADGKNWTKVGGRPAPFGPDITGSTYKGEWIYALVWDGTDLYVSFASIPTSAQPMVWKYTPN